jgi:general nucleoside transport system ATP-binding protein
MQIELRHIHKRFGAVHANNDINLNISSGRIVGILGENGAGKSTLMKILAGYQPADSGEIWLDNQRVAYNNPQTAIRSGIGMLQQDPLDIAAFTVLENFTYGQSGGLGMSQRAARAQLAQISRRLGFELDPDLPIAQLLALGIRTLILDEPTTGISSEQKSTLFNALRELAAQDSMSILLVSHKLEDVIALCNEVVVLRTGRLVGRLQMPATTSQLVQLMFGQELAPPSEPKGLTKPSQTAFVLDNATVRSKRIAVEHLTLTVHPGEIIGFAGLEGSGQELVLRACVGLEHPMHGHVLVNDRDMTGKPYRDFLRAGVAFGAAGRLEEGLVAGLTLTEHIALVSETGTLIDWNSARRHTAEQIKLYNVRGQADSPIETLSGGNQQRVLMALMPEQPVLMALENPTRGLDVESARWIWQQLLARRQRGTAIIFSSPELDELVAYSDRILVFYAGRVVEIDARRATIDELGRLIGGQFDERHL